MNIKTLEYVIEIVQCGSINQAAQNLYLSQPNLSNSIKTLENEIGFKIFKRKSSGIELTPEGAVFLKSAKRIYMEWEKIKKIPSLFQEYQDLSITSTYSALFMQIFIGFRNKYPKEDIQDTFKETGLIQTFLDIVEQRYRLSIFYCFDCRAEYHQKRAERYSLQMEPLFSHVPVEVLVSTSNPLSRRSSFDFNEIKKYPIVAYENFKYEDWLGVLEIDPEQKVTKIFDRGGLRDTILKSNTIAVIKKGSVDTGTNHLCTTLPINGPSPQLNIYMLKQKNYQLSPREKDFIRHFKKQLAAYYRS